MSGAAAPATGRRLRDRTGAAAAAAALALFGYVAIRSTGFPAPFGLGTTAGLVLLLALSAAVGASPLRGAFWTGGVLLAAVLLVVGLTPVIRGPAHRLVRADPWPAAPVDAVVVLSGWLTEDGHLTPTAADRLLTGLAVARRHGVGELVTSRVSREVDGRTLTSDADQRALAGLLTPAPRLSTVAPVASTRDEAVRVAALADSVGWSHVAVVTSPSHTRRACATFERAGLRVTCVPAATRNVSWGALESVSDRLRAAADVAYEAVATVVYRRRGWL